MNNTERIDAHDEVRLADVFRPLVHYRQLILRGSFAVILLVGLAAGLYLILQPTTWTAVIGFRPIFQGAAQHKYPNDLPFSATDIVSPSVIEQVFEKNSLSNYCAIEAFQSALTVHESSPALQFLNLDYQSRLSDPRLSGLDRQRLMEEYSSRRAALQPEYQLVYVRPLQCAAIPQQIVYKALSEILETWATESDTKRGVMRLRLGIISPALFDDSGTKEEPLLVRADLTRTAMLRVIANISGLEKLPGAELIRVGPEKISLTEVRARMEDLMRARLDPLIAVAGSGLGRQSLRWVEQALQTANVQLRAAQQRADSYRLALREYSGMPTTPPASPTTDRPGQPAASDVQALTPQIDRTFIDGIVQMSAANTQFRQEITRQVIAASVDAVDRASNVEHYRMLLEAMQRGATESLSMDEVTRRLAAIATEAKELTSRFNDIYNEFSRVSLRIGPAMYRIEQPADGITARAFSVRDYLFVLLVVMLAAPVALAIMFLIHYHLRKFIQTSLKSARVAS